MALLEIDSFYIKFKNLLLSGRNATLTIKSNDGKAEVNLHVELDSVHLKPAQEYHHYHRGSRNGPARQRRRLRREKARGELDAENVSKPNEEVVAEEAANDISDPKTLKDEFCSVDAFEENLVETIVVTAECTTDLVDDKNVAEQVEAKLYSLGIKVRKIELKKNHKGISESLLVSIKPIEKKNIEAATFPLSVSGWRIRIS